jgi:hypothetical protein
LHCNIDTREPGKHGSDSMKRGADTHCKKPQGPYPLRGTGAAGAGAKASAPIGL